MPNSITYTFYALRAIKQQGVFTMKDTNKTMDSLLDTCKLFAAAILVAVLLLAFAGCEKGRADNTPTQTIPSTQQTTQSETTQAPTIKETTPAVETTPAAETTASTEEAWKIEFEKSLLENYGVTPEYYEDLGGGVYQVYVKIDGKTVPYVTVDSATGDYHG